MAVIANQISGMWELLHGQLLVVMGREIVLQLAASERQARFVMRGDFRAINCGRECPIADLVGKVVTLHVPMVPWLPVMTGDLGAPYVSLAEYPRI